MSKIFVLLSCLGLSLAGGIVMDETAGTTLSPPPKPYAFGYAAGRAPGSIDRTHSEISDGNGQVQGSFSYIDPLHKIRTVDYIADKNGFHPTLNFAPTDTRAVAAAKDRHNTLFRAIASNHQQGVVHVPQESAAVARAKEAHLIQYHRIAESHRYPENRLQPLDSEAVQRQTQKHFDLYAQIASEHARIAAEHKVQQELGEIDEDAVKSSSQVHKIVSK